MLIDWFTVAAQVLNFLILVWLLKRYLYKPVLDAIDAREGRIRLELTSAAARQAEATAQRNDLQKKNAAFDEQRAGLLADAAQQGAADRARLVGEARQEADGLRVDYADAMRADEARLGLEISRLAQEEVFGMARKALSDLCDARLEDRIGDVFVQRLRALGTDTKNKLSVALQTSADAASLRSNFQLSAEQRRVIQATLNEVFGADIRIQFDTQRDTICGIELSVNGQKLAWSVADYLDGLERKVVELLEAEPAPEAVLGAAAS